MKMRGVRLQDETSKRVDRKAKAAGMAPGTWLRVIIEAAADGEVGEGFTVVRDAKPEEADLPAGDWWLSEGEQRAAKEAETPIVVEISRETYDRTVTPRLDDRIDASINGATTAVVAQTAENTFAEEPIEVTAFYEGYAEVAGEPEEPERTPGYAKTGPTWPEVVEERRRERQAKAAGQPFRGS